eukprot:1513666-Ditylum_brightwellii.AAC.1
MKDLALNIDKKKLEDRMMAIETDHAPSDVSIENISEADFDWKEMIRYCNYDVMLKTLKTTSQYFLTHVEAVYVHSSTGNNNFFH